MERPIVGIARRDPILLQAATIPPNRTLAGVRNDSGRCPLGCPPRPAPLAPLAVSTAGCPPLATSEMYSTHSERTHPRRRGRHAAKPAATPSGHPAGSGRSGRNSGRRLGPPTSPRSLSRLAVGPAASAVAHQMVGGQLHEKQQRPRPLFGGGAPVRRPPMGGVETEGKSAQRPVAPRAPWQ